MEFVLNKCYGGFSLSKEACAMLNCDRYDFSDDYTPTRTDPRLVDCVHKLGIRADGRYARLCIVEIPWNATDWEINDYDGMETLIYVVNGKIYHA